MFDDVNTTCVLYMKCLEGVGPSFSTSAILVRLIPVLHFKSPHPTLLMLMWRYVPVPPLAPITVNNSRIRCLY